MHSDKELLEEITKIPISFEPAEIFLASMGAPIGGFVIVPLWVCGEFGPHEEEVLDVFLGYSFLSCGISRSYPSSCRRIHTASIRLNLDIYQCLKFLGKQREIKCEETSVSVKNPEILGLQTLAFFHGCDLIASVKKLNRINEGHWHSAEEWIASGLRKKQRQSHNKE